MRKSLGLVAVVAVVGLTLSGCDLFSGDENGRFILRLTDAPHEVTSVTVSIVGCELIDSETGERESVELDPAAEGINLLDYQNGATLTIADKPVTIDKFDQLRLVVDDSSKIMVDGVEWDLHVSSGTSSGIKFFLDDPVDMDGGTFDVTMDFDAAESVVALGPPTAPTGYVMTPVIRPVIAMLNNSEVVLTEAPEQTGEAP